MTIGNAMRILHVVPSYYPAVRYGGPIRSVHELAHASARRGHDVHVYTTNVDGAGVSDVPLGVPVVRDDVQVWYFASPFGRRLYFSPAMGRALRTNVPGFDIVHTHSVFLWPTLAAARAARRSGVPYVVSPRGMLVADLIRRKSGLAKRAWLALFERRTIEEAAAVHVTSTIEADEITHLGLSPRTMVVVPNGVETPPAADTAMPPAPGGRPMVLFLGRMNWKKGLDRLIPAMAAVPDAELVIAGNDEENYKTVLEDLAHASHVSERVRFAGFVEGRQKWELLRKARMLVLPSYSENFGNVVLEAMAVGCPVVLTPDVGLASAVRSANAGIVSSGEPGELAGAINTLLKDAALCRRMGEAGRATAAKDYSWDAVAGQVDAVYRRLINARMPQRS